MAFAEIYIEDLTVTVGESTKASDYNNLANNTDALKERFQIGHYWNDIGVTNEDGFIKGDRLDPAWHYNKTSGRYWCLFSNATSNDLRFYINDATTTPGATAGQILLAGL